MPAVAKSLCWIWAIDTLARNLIKLLGLQPYVDIEIQYSELRSGEKLEEKLMNEEGMRTTANERIHISCPIPSDGDEFSYNSMS